MRKQIVSNTAKVLQGLFLTDPKRSFWGRVWQLFSRFTWELPQTLVGWFYTLGRTLLGQVDRVDTLGGITFATKKTGKMGCMGVSLGSFVELWDGHWLNDGDKGLVLGNQLCSLISALGRGDHSAFWTEIRANRHAKRYFGQRYGVDWSEYGYPTERRKSKRNGLKSVES